MDPTDTGFRTETENAAYGRSWNTETAAGALVIGSLLFIVLVRRGFRGVLVDLSS